MAVFEASSFTEEKSENDRLILLIVPAKHAIAQTMERNLIICHNVRKRRARSGQDRQDFLQEAADLKNQASG